jgi:hypothetical protein
MLVECVRRYAFGQSSSLPSNATHKFENFLGPKIPVWFKNELDKSITNEGLRENGKAYLYTTADVAKNQPQWHDSKIGGFLDKKGAKQITGQIALMSRLRSMLLLNTEADFRKKTIRAITASARFNETWDNKPTWWDDSSEEHSFLLLTRLNSYGFLKMMTTAEATAGFGAPDDDDIGTLKDIGLSKPIIQQRANQLVRELHLIEESEKVLRRFDRRSLDSLASLPSASNSSSSSSTSANNKKAIKQTDMMSFFQPRSSEKKKKRPSSVGSVETADSDLRRGWRKSSGSNSTSPDSLASVGKRKDPPQTESQEVDSDNNDLIILDGDSDLDGVPSPSEKKKAKSGDMSKR